MKRLKKSLAFITTISMLATLAACNNSADSNDSNDELQQHVSEVVGKVTSMRDALDKAKENVTSPNYDDLHSDKGRTISEIDSLIEEKQEQIDKILEKYEEN
ncbi:MAG: hypothetical protein ACLUV3_01035 [Oscillospiraceae bacterium]